MIKALLSSAEHKDVGKKAYAVFVFVMKKR